MRIVAAMLGFTAASCAVRASLALRDTGASRTLLNTYSMGQGSDMDYPASDAFAAAPDMTTGSSLSSGMPMAVPDPSPPAEPEAAATMADPPAAADAGAAIADPASEKPQQTSAAAPAAAGGIVKKFKEDSLERGPCAMSTVAGFVCQKAHVNGTLRIHWTPFKKGDTSATMAVELIGKVTGWVGIAWTEIPGNMIGSDAIVVTDSAPNGMGVYKLNAKNVNGVVLQSGDEPDFKISNMTYARDAKNKRTVGSFTRAFSKSFDGDMVYRMIGAAGDTNELAFHGPKYRAFKWSLSQPGPLDNVPGMAALPPGLRLDPAAYGGDASTVPVTQLTPVAPPPASAVGKAPTPPAPPPVAAARAAGGGNTDDAVTLAPAEGPAGAPGGVNAIAGNGASDTAAPVSSAPLGVLVASASVIAAISTLLSLCV